MQPAGDYLNFEVVGFTAEEAAELDEIGLRDGFKRPAFRAYVLGRDLAEATRRLWDVYPGARGCVEFWFSCGEIAEIVHSADLEDK